MSPSSPLRTGRFSTIPVCKRETLGQSKSSYSTRMLTPIHATEFTQCLSAGARAGHWERPVGVQKRLHESRQRQQQAKRGESPASCAEEHKERRLSGEVMLGLLQKLATPTSRRQHLPGACSSAAAPLAPPDSLLCKAESHSVSQAEPEPGPPPKSGPSSPPPPPISGVTRLRFPAGLRGWLLISSSPYLGSELRSLPVWPEAPGQPRRHNDQEVVAAAAATLL